MPQHLAHRGHRERAVDRAPGPAGSAGSTDADRGAALAVVVEGFGAVAWLGWAQVSADAWLSTLLTAASLAAFVVGVVGFVRAARAASGPAPGGPVLGRYLVLLGTAVVAAVAGLLLLAVLGGLRWAPVWVCLVSGAHLVPLAGLLGNRLLAAAGVALVAVSVLALAASAAGLTGPATVPGAGAGGCLLVAALLTLGRRGSDRHP